MEKERKTALDVGWRTQGDKIVLATITSEQRTHEEETYKEIITQRQRERDNIGIYGEK